MRHRCSLACKVHRWHLRRGNPDRAARDNDAGHDQRTCDHHTPTLRHDCLHAYATISHLRESRLKSGRKNRQRTLRMVNGAGDQKVGTRAFFIGGDKTNGAHPPRTVEFVVYLKVQREARPTLPPRAGLPPHLELATGGSVAWLSKHSDSPSVRCESCR